MLSQAAVHDIERLRPRPNSRQPSADDSQDGGSQRSWSRSPQPSGHREVVLEQRVDVLTKENEVLSARLSEAAQEVKHLQDKAQPTEKVGGVKRWKLKVDELMQQHQEEKETQNASHLTTISVLRMQVIDLQAKHTRSREEVVKLHDEVASLQKECQKKASMVVELETQCSELKAMLDSHSRSTRDTVCQLEMELEAERIMRSPSQLHLDTMVATSKSLNLGFGESMEADLREVNAEDVLPENEAVRNSEQEAMFEGVGNSTLDLQAELAREVSMLRQVSGDSSGNASRAAVTPTLNGARKGADSGWRSQCATMKNLLVRTQIELQQAALKMQPLAQH